MLLFIVVFVFVDDDIFIATETVVLSDYSFCQMKKEQSRAAALEALLEEERKSHKVFYFDNLDRRAYFPVVFFSHFSPQYLL